VKLGAVFPQTEIEPDAGAIRAYAQGVEALGFDHLLVYDHVTGVDHGLHPDFAEQARRGGARAKRPYDIHSRFHEVMVLLGYLAAITERLGLVSSVLVLPQRQTALAAKQAAEVDLLSGERLRLGVGVGWNPIEYRSMGRTFADRGARLSEQIPLLRRYWSETPVVFEGEHEWAVGVGLAPLPARPIPVWIAGGERRRALERVGRLGDGWLPVSTDPDALGPLLERILTIAAEAGREPPGVQGRIDGTEDLDRAGAALEGWQRLGATYVALNTMNEGRHGVDAHLAALERALEVTR
jgi:probable F420-dependent oxidoreductase